MTNLSLNQLLLLLLAVHQCLAVCENMGEGECHGDTCRPGQYCSDARLFEGCRNCTHLIPWCPNVTKLERDFPQCVHICDLKTAIDKVQTREAEVETLKAWIQSLQQTISQQNRSAAHTEEKLNGVMANLEDTKAALTKTIDNNALLRTSYNMERNKSSACEHRHSTKVTELERTKKQLEDVKNEKDYQIIVMTCGGFIMGLPLLLVSLCLCQSKKTIRQYQNQLRNKDLSSAASSAASEKSSCCCRPWQSWNRFSYVAQPNPDPMSSQPMLPLPKVTPPPSTSAIKGEVVQAHPDPSCHPQTTPTVTYAPSASAENFSVINTHGKNGSCVTISATSLATTTASARTNGSSVSSSVSGSNFNASNSSNAHVHGNNVCSATSLASTESNGNSTVFSDSGNSTASNGSSDSCLRKVVAPTGDRTEHDYEDGQDFLTVAENTRCSTRTDQVTDSASVWAVSH